MFGVAIEIALNVAVKSKKQLRTAKDLYQLF